MKKIHSLILPGALMFVALAESLHAVPAFAKQSGLECFACHSLSQSTLNSVGRKFARSSYMMTKEDGSSSLISGQKMGLGTDTALNASILLKARLEKGYDVINGKGEVIETQDEEEVGANRGVYEMFKTSTAHLGGKVVSHVGALMELREKEGKAVFGGKVISSMNTDDSSYAGITLYSTDNYGPFSGMENYATGLYKPLRQFENHKLTNAAQAADLGTGSATGLQAFYAGEVIFATIGAYVPLHHNDEIEASTSMIPFARLAFEQNIGNLNFIIGAYGLKGTATAYNTSLDSSLSGLVPRETVEIEKQAYGLDLQIEGD
ncbi:MAG: hypothetical protein PHW94_07830, partial [Sulfurimonas sp.]|nr:hypothetical protein [Sulfurimonas sp.]